jgi:malate/lactate dehydrogenase
MLNQVLNTPEMLEQIKQSTPYVAQEIVKKVTASATEYAKNMAVKRMVDSNDERIQKLQTLGEWLQKQEN